MNQFTIKDFIEYNTPCKICGELSKLTLFADGRYIKPNKKVGTLLSYSLVTTYKPEDAKTIVFDAKTNTFISTFDASESTFQFILACNKSCVTITSQYLKFNSNFIDPLTIIEEYVQIKTESIYYSIKTINRIPRSFLYTTIIGSAERGKEISIPLLPISKWKTKDNLELIIKTYMAFS